MMLDRSYILNLLFDVHCTLAKVARLEKNNGMLLEMTNWTYHRTVWKEACHCSGYSFWPELGEAEMCFDFKTEGTDSAAIDKAKKEQWTRQHLCIHCAFYETNGYDPYVPLDNKS